MKIALVELMGLFTTGIDIFICSSSFEDRSTAIANSLNSDAVKHALICVHTDFSQFSDRNTAKLESMFASKFSSANIHTDLPLLCADTFSAALTDMPTTANSTILIDSTTFTHETLLILLQVVRKLRTKGRVIIAYTGAEEYGVGLPTDEMWLSKGVDDVRSVLGYPGAMLPSRSLHLIVLVGFESERAEKLIEACDASRISLGIGSQESSVNQKHHATNLAFHGKVNKFAANIAATYACIDSFSFSCTDPIEAKKAILEQAGRCSQCNTVVAPMNTKLSTIGAALAAFEDDAIQIIYAHPIVYNTETYSSPGLSCRIFDFTQWID